MEVTFSCHPWASQIDPNLPVRLVQSCLSLGPTSCALRVYEAAVRGHRDPADGALRRAWHRTTTQHRPPARPVASVSRFPSGPSGSPSRAPL